MIVSYTIGGPLLSDSDCHDGQCGLRQRSSDAATAGQSAAVAHRTRSDRYDTEITIKYCKNGSHLWAHCDCYHSSVWQGLSQMMVTFYWSTIDCKVLMREFAHWVLAGLHWLFIAKTWKLTMTCRRNFLKVTISQKEIICVYAVLNWGCVWCGRASGGDRRVSTWIIATAFMTSLTLNRSVKWTSKSQSET